MAYATSNGYLTYTGTTVPPTGLARLLEVASTRIDELLVGAVYDVDVNGAPTDSGLVDVLSRATCEQVLWMLDTGDVGGTGSGGFTEQTVGRVSWKTGNGAADASPSGSRYAPEAISLLHTEGLLPVAVFRP